jgi:hypothetical protein
MMRDAAGGRRLVRELGRLERGWVLTAWEDGGSAVLQVGVARRGGGVSLGISVGYAGIGCGSPSWLLALYVFC